MIGHVKGKIESAYAAANYQDISFDRFSHISGMRIFLKVIVLENTIPGRNICKTLRGKGDKFSVVGSFFLFKAFQGTCYNKDDARKDNGVQKLYHIGKESRNIITGQRKKENPYKGAEDAEKKEYPEWHGRYTGESCCKASYNRNKACKKNGF